MSTPSAQLQSELIRINSPITISIVGDYLRIERHTLGIISLKIPKGYVPSVTIAVAMVMDLEQIKIENGEKENSSE